MYGEIMFCSQFRDMSRGGHVEPMDEETKRLYDLVHYSGITMDPNLFVNITDLLKVGPTF